MAQASRARLEEILTFLSESGKRPYSITASRMISGLVRKYRKGLRFVMPAG